VQCGQSILVADGSLVLTVVSTDVASGKVVTRIENNAKIGERKNMNLPGVVVDLPTCPSKNRALGIQGTESDGSYDPSDTSNDARQGR
jgi:pyruvate kinase